MFPKRSIALVFSPNSTQENTANSILPDAVIKCLEETTKSHHILKSGDPQELLGQLNDLDTELILWANSDWKPTTKAIKDLVYGYEHGARVTSLRQTPDFPLTSIKSIQILWLYIFFGAKRKDPTSPVRLYDKEAFVQILRVLMHFLPAKNQLPEPYIFSALEHYFGFCLFGVEALEMGAKDAAKDANANKKQSSSPNFKDTPTDAPLSANAQSSGTQTFADWTTKVDFLELIKIANQLKSAIRTYNNQNIIKAGA